MPQNTSLPSAAKRAMAAIRYFEKEGREVVGVRIKGSEFQLDFAQTKEIVDDGASLVNMGE